MVRGEENVYDKPVTGRAHRVDLSPYTGPLQSPALFHLQTTFRHGRRGRIGPQHEDSYTLHNKESG